MPETVVLPLDDLAIDRGVIIPKIVDFSMPFLCYTFPCDMQSTDIKEFKRVVWSYYKKSGRHTLPWRKTVDPYRILVSEIMLQQTQVDRVIPKYQAFLKAFPTVKKLAEAKLSYVLALWSGLGYNRRAKYLHEMAHVVAGVYKGKFPKITTELQKLPGVGPYTGGAVSAFAYNEPVVLIETNIRTVYLHHFFSHKKNISDAKLIPIIETTLDRSNPREWYWALMDYGSYLKKQGSTAHRTSKHYTKQSAFAGSRRQVRGAIMRELLKGPLTAKVLAQRVQKDTTIIESVLVDLSNEGFVIKSKNKYLLV